MNENKGPIVDTRGQWAAIYSGLTIAHTEDHYGRRRLAWARCDFCSVLNLQVYFYIPLLYGTIARINKPYLPSDLFANAKTTPELQQLYKQRRTLTCVNKHAKNGHSAAVH
ncbi:hypothetical protein Zmor_003178 [Zophobas morio]|uniref:Uncharacterized protein n=1 Tax=Zophobas morio TaxID=2755281 RepID=A0AA38HL62_9CUCU|nr:hypothetical protein Zmor_003178 [Zophobas morio]